MHQLYKTGQVAVAKPGRGILETFTITSDTGKMFLVASDSGCTSPLILQEAISEGLILNVQSGTRAMIQVAGGDKIPGTTYMCLLPLEETNDRYNYKETLATAVPTTIADIPLMDIKMLSIDMFKEYTNECETTGEEQIYKLEHLPSCYGGRISMLLSSQTFRPKVFFTSKEE